jgi:hypothetical protein
MISSISSLLITVKTLKRNKENVDKTVFEKKILVNKMINYSLENNNLVSDY